jgi:hypothetical protein
LRAGSLALAIDSSFDHRRVSAVHLIREAESWGALRTGEAEQMKKIKIWNGP